MSCGSPIASPFESETLRDRRPAAAPEPTPFWRPLLRRMIERQRQRRALRVLDERLLRDIGITREAAEREAGKGFWR